MKENLLFILAICFVAILLVVFIITTSPVWLYRKISGKPCFEYEPKYTGWGSAS